MTKKRKNRSVDMPLFEWVKKAEALSRQTENPPHGSLDIDKEFRSAIREDIRHAVDDSGAFISQAIVAARMSDLTGRRITDDMLYNWTAQTDEKQLQRFPCIFLPAFIIATGGQRRAAEVLSRYSGLFMLPGPEALRAEIQRWRETEKRAKSERQKRELFLKEIENA